MEILSIHATIVAMSDILLIQRTSKFTGCKNIGKILVDVLSTTSFVYVKNHGIVAMQLIMSIKISDSLLKHQENLKISTMVVETFLVTLACKRKRYMVSKT